MQTGGKMDQKISLDTNWGQQLFPNGMNIPSSVIISGKNGSGKPLAELAFLAQWLKQGGKAIGIPLQYPDATFLKTSLYKLYGMNMDDYDQQNVYIHFDPKEPNITEFGEREMSVNLLKPELWDEMIELSLNKLNAQPEEVLLFGSALNLLLFAPRYAEQSATHIKKLIENTNGLTVVFTVSNNVMGDRIAMWENAADNLLFTEMREWQLYIYGQRINGVADKTAKYEVPFQAQTLIDIKNIAKKNRNRLVPVLKQIK